MQQEIQSLLPQPVKMQIFGSYNRYKSKYN